MIRTHLRLLIGYFLLPIFLVLIALISTSKTSLAYEGHGIALAGTELEHKLGFKHFNYVNPNAPKGGRVRLAAVGSFDTLNAFAQKGEIASGIGLIYEKLFTRSLSEPSSQYGLIAEKISYPDDFSTVTFDLNKAAYWHDKTPISVEDVIFSFETIIKQIPFYANYYQHVESVKKTGENQVTFYFDIKNNRELPSIVSELLIMPKHWWQGKDSKGNPRDISKSTLEYPLGSGAYKVSKMDTGRSITFTRVNDAWAVNHPTQIGKNNFDTITYEYYRSPVAAFEAFKAGKIDWRDEYTAKNWATAYNFPAVRDKRVKLEKFPTHNTGIMQAWVFNLRLNKFNDARVRQAFDLAFNFEDANKTLFYGQYERIQSYFHGIDLASKGLPSKEELKILEPLKAELPKKVFTTAYKSPKNDNPNIRRKNLRLAAKLLNEAGWKIKNGVRTNQKGEKLEVEVLIANQAFTAINLRYAKNLEPLGIKLKPRVVDVSQYISRVRSKDFDIIVGSWGQSISPGNEQFGYWGSKSANVDSSRNYAGISNPVIDKLINRLVVSADYDDLITATRALDRVLLNNHYVVPMWASGNSRTARWDYYDHPDPLPYYSVGFPTIWWSKEN